MLETYIQESWPRLTRNALDVAFDPKVPAGTSRLYIAPTENAEEIHARLARYDHPVQLKILPESFIVTRKHGLLYLPNDYVVPGGRFNEMYAWDSYWVILGLIQDGHARLARGMVENFVYQIHHYGKTLNANRTYYLTRSQPPLLSRMAEAVLPSIPAEERDAFLQTTADAIADEYRNFWKKSRLDKRISLFHYGHKDRGYFGPCAEVLFGERDENGLTHYDKVAAWLRDLPPDNPKRKRFLDQTTDRLTPAAYAGDRAMRESGFDTSMHMGPYGMETLDYAPVCLNTLLHAQNKWLEKTYEALGFADRAAYFGNEAARLAEAIQHRMWNDPKGLFFNYNRRERAQSDFPFLTCAYPLWGGIATPQQAVRFCDNLRIFETTYGLQGTNVQSGCQWDSPFMWPPLVYFAVAGLHRYGYTLEAARIAQKFIDTVARVFGQTGVNFEKYNAAWGDSTTSGIIDVGYSENVIGFGWTNGAVRLLQAWLKDKAVPL